MSDLSVPSSCSDAVIPGDAARNQRSPRDYFVRPGLLPTNWPYFPRNNAPVAAYVSVGGFLQRRIVATAFGLKKCRAVTLKNWDRLNTDERFGVAATAWGKAVMALRGTDLKTLKTPLAKTIMRKLYTCDPPGYTLERGKAHWCNLSICVFCHARRIGRVYRHIREAWLRRPTKETPVYIAPFRLICSRKAMNTRIHDMRPLGAALLRRPDPEHKLALDDPRAKWIHTGVLLFDNLDKIRNKKRERIRSRKQIVSYLSRWMWYPYKWNPKSQIGVLSDSINLLAEVPPRTQLMGVYGACREDYVAGKGWFDYTTIDGCTL